MDPPPLPTRIILFLSHSASTMARIWLCFLLSCVIFLLVRPNAASIFSFDNGKGPLDAGVEITLRDSSAVVGTPALFGNVKERGTWSVRIWVFEGQTGCMPFVWENDVENDGGEEKEFESEDYILLPRGSCPFDTKIRHAERAGFKGAIIYNIPSFPDESVRMSTTTTMGGEESISIFALFLTRDAGEFLRDVAGVRTGGGVKMGVVDAKVDIVKWENPNHSDQRERQKKYYPEQQRSGIDPDQWTSPPLTGPDIWGDALVSVFCLVLGALGALAVGTSLVLIHNRLFASYGSTSTTNVCARVVVDRNGEMMVERVKLPLRVVESGDLEWGGKGKGGFGGGEKDKGKKDNDITTGEEGEEQNGRLKTDCCAICIDEFGVGCRVRELPCRHVFHDSCIDPWLLHHALLCPVCKRSIIPTPIPPLSRRTSSVSIVVEDQAPLLDSERPRGYLAGLFGMRG